MRLFLVGSPGDDALETPACWLLAWLRSHAASAGTGAACGGKSACRALPGLQRRFTGHADNADGCSEQAAAGRWYYVPVRGLPRAACPCPFPGRAVGTAHQGEGAVLSPGAVPCASPAMASPPSRDSPSLPRAVKSACQHPSSSPARGVCCPSSHKGWGGYVCGQKPLGSSLTQDTNACRAPAASGLLAFPAGSGRGALALAVVVRKTSPPYPDSHSLCLGVSLPFAPVAPRRLPARHRPRRTAACRLRGGWAWGLWGQGPSWQAGRCSGEESLWATTDPAAGA